MLTEGRLTATRRDSGLAGPQTSCNNLVTFLPLLPLLPLPETHTHTAYLHTHSLAHVPAIKYTVMYARKHALACTTPAHTHPLWHTGALHMMGSNRPRFDYAVTTPWRNLAQL